MWKYYPFVQQIELHPEFDHLPPDVKAQNIAMALGPLLDSATKAIATLPDAKGLIGDIVSHNLTRFGNTVIVTFVIRYPNS